MATTIEPRRELPTHQHPEEPGTGLMSWLTTVDHKRIGIMYLVVTLFFFLIGGLMALIMRIQLETADGSAVSPERYNQIFTMHGTTMVFLFVVPIMAAFGNYIVPLQIGARDMAFPRLNAASLWLLLFGGMLHLLELPVRRRPGRRLDRLSAAVGASRPGTASTSGSSACTCWRSSSVAGAINFICTIHNMRAPGMRLSRMPLFTWTIDFYAIMILFALPVLAGALTMLLLDRNFGTNFYDPQQRRQHHPLPAPVLVLRAPRGLRGGAARLRHDLRDRPGLLAQAAVRLQGARDLGRGDRLPRLPGLGPPHVRGRSSRPRWRSGSCSRRWAIARAHRRQDVQLDRHDVDGPDPFRAADALRRRVHRHVHDRRPLGHLRWPPSRSTCT